MLRITLLTDDPSQAELRLEGRIVGEWATLLRCECGSLLARSTSLVLDLGGVSYVDGAGAEVLAALPPERVRYRNQSPLLHAIISDRGTGWTPPNG